jgi:hypothetical protein
VRTSRRYQLRLPAPLSSELEDFARRHGLGLAPAIRLLVGRGLELEAKWLRPLDSAPDSPAALAALTAAEHSVLMVASVLPEGQRRMHELAARAAVAAEERLALFRESSS